MLAVECRLQICHLPEQYAACLHPFNLEEAVNLLSLIQVYESVKLTDV